MPNTKAVGVAFSDPEFESVSVSGASSFTGNVTTAGNIRMANTKVLQWGTSDAAGIIGKDNSASDGYLAFSANNEKMRILVNGNVGINETAPDYKLDVNGTFGFTPGSSVAPVDNGDVVIEATNNTTLTFKLKGSDGTIRSATLTLAP